jgi:hypothetical protein
MKPNRFVILALTLTLPLAAAAQGVDRGRVYSRADVEHVIKRAENSADSFRSAVDRRLDRSALNATEREDFINAQVKQLENQLDVLRAKFDRTDRWIDTREEVAKVLADARDVQGVMNRAPFGKHLRVEWRALRADLNTLAGVYNLPKL